MILKICIYICVFVWNLRSELFHWTVEDLRGLSVDRVGGGTLAAASNALRPSHGSIKEVNFTNGTSETVLKIKLLKPTLAHTKPG